MSTVKTAFGGGIELVNLDKGTSIPGRFVFQLPDEFTPTHIRDGFCQAVVFDQVLDLQTLDTDRLVLTDQLCREFLLVITASITNTSMKTSDLEPCLGAVLGALLFLGEATVRTCQFLLLLAEELGVAVSVPVTSDHHRLQPQVNSHLFGNNGQELDVFFD